MKYNLVCLLIMLSLVGCAEKRETTRQQGEHIEEAQKEYKNPILNSAKKLMEQKEYYEALMKLKPLLTQEKYSEDQMELYYFANQACVELTSQHILVREFEKIHGTNRMQWEKIRQINQLGAEIGFDELACCYTYNFGFLKKLIDRYPKSGYVPSAKFYTIRHRFNDINEINEELKELNDYIKIYPNLKESDLAGLRVAHINDNLWQLLYFQYDRLEGANSLSGYYKYFSSGDRQQDKRRSIKFKENALELYKKLIGSKYIEETEKQKINARYEELKMNLPTRGPLWIIYD